MSLGPLMVDIEGRALVDEDREILSHPLVGGVILFTRNFESREQITGLVREIHGLRQPHLIVAVDHEGGPVQRFHSEFTHLPAASQLGAVYRKNADLALQYTREIGWLLATELRVTGVDISLTPVLDIEKKGSRVLKDRTYHDDPQVVAEMARKLMSGMQEAGMQATGKHFPGHGGVRGDSHEELPVDNRSYEDIQSHDIVPFERMIHYGLAGIMPAHVVYLQVDSNPAGFSAFWIKEVLRRRLGFNGLIYSDDLSMAGAHHAGGYIQRSKAALDAGCDIILICNNREGVIEVLDQLELPPDPVLQSRIARMHGRVVKGIKRFQQSERWRNAVNLVHEIHDRYPVEQEFDF